MTETLDSLVQSILDAKGWTLGQLATRAKISTAGLRLLRGGATVKPRGPTVRDLAKALGVPPDRVRAAIAASRAPKG